MPTPKRRPFYTDFAWAFDLLIERPVAKECGVILTWLIDAAFVQGPRYWMRGAEPVGTPGGALGGGSFSIAPGSGVVTATRVPSGSVTMNV